MVPNAAWAVRSNWQKASQMPKKHFLQPHFAPIALLADAGRKLPELDTGRVRLHFALASKEQFANHGIEEAVFSAAKDSTSCCGLISCAFNLPRFEADSSYSQMSM